MSGAHAAFLPFLSRIFGLELALIIVFQQSRILPIISPCLTTSKYGNKPDMDSKRVDHFSFSSLGRIPNNHIEENKHAVAIVIVSLAIRGNTLLI